MDHGRRSTRRYLILVPALLALFALTLAGGASAAEEAPWLAQTADVNSAVTPAWLPQPSQAATCPDAYIVWYYSDSTYTTQVGACQHACCKLWTCTGELTLYSRIAATWTCDFN